MADDLSLTGQRVLVVEDEPLIAMDIAQAVEDVGGIVIGPAFTVTDAREHANTGEITVALLGVKFNQETTASIAHALASRGIPFVFYTGYSRNDLVEAWPGAPVLVKPCSSADVVKALNAAVAKVRALKP